MTDLAVDYAELRPLVFSIAYRMLGTVSEAEDVAQEAFLRMHKSTLEGSPPESPAAFATTVTTRLAIDALRSARRRREVYAGSWLPEPLLDTDTDPAHRVELDETVSVAFLVVLESLSPVERAVFLLREVFGYGYDEIATVVDKSEANCRQMLVRAKRHIDQAAPRFDPSPERRAELADSFLAALHEGDVAELERLLAEDAVFYGDGGGKAPAVAKPLRGALQVARFLVGLRRAGSRFDASFEAVQANGQPGLRLLIGDGELVGLMSLQIVDSRVVAIHNQINPDKLAHLGAVGDLAALMGDGA